MTNHIIVSIGRQFGSGGHEIGNKLSERLDIPLYDRNLVRMAAEQLKISDEAAEEVDETSLNRFLAYYASAPVDYTMYYTSMTSAEMGQPLSEQIYQAETQIIKRLAARSSCIIVGRCADHILAEEPGLINVFITASKEDRIKRIAQRYDLTERKAADRIKKVDRERRYYYELHTGKDWGSVDSHGIFLNVSMLGIDGAVDTLEALFKAKK